MSKPISGYNPLTAPAPDDLLVVVDVHDPFMAPTGTTKKITVANLLTVGGMVLLASTGTVPYTLVNGTGVVVSWTAPNDGALHRVLFGATIAVSSTETGGQIIGTVVAPNGAGPAQPQLIAANQGTGAHVGNGGPFMVESGSTVTIQQGTALTGGAAILWAEIWGS